MQALILAGGLGTRLRSVVADRPKSMAAVDDRPFLAYQIACLKRWGVDHVVLCVGYLHEHVSAHFGDGAALGVRIDYSVEDHPLGTGGAVKWAERFVRGPFLVLNGDTYFDIDLRAMARAHRRRAAPGGSNAQANHPAEGAGAGPLGTVAVVEVADARAYGSVALRADGRIEAFREKSAAPEPGFINAGIYWLEKDVMNYIPSGRAVSLERDVFPDLVADRRGMYAFPATGFFVDIGTPDGYAAFIAHIRAQGAHSHDHPEQGAASA